QHPRGCPAGRMFPQTKMWRSNLGMELDYRKSKVRRQHPEGKLGGSCLLHSSSLLILQRHHDLVAFAERGDALQGSPSAGQRHDWSIAIYGVPCSRPVPLAALLRTGLSLLDEMRLGLI